MLEEILERYSEEELLIADGFNDAIIGIDENSLRIIYSVTKCIEILMKDMSEEDALEYFSYNVSGAYVGEKTPIWCEDNF
jgi:sRNA-binding carbon storage regulator CsrA